jgi:hypothetical protein
MTTPSSGTAAGIQTNAAMPVMERPTMSVFISRVPSYE